MSVRFIAVVRRDGTFKICALCDGERRLPESSSGASRPNPDAHYSEITSRKRTLAACGTLWRRQQRARIWPTPPNQQYLKCPPKCPRPRCPRIRKHVQPRRSQPLCSTCIVPMKRFTHGETSLYISPPLLWDCVSLWGSSRRLNSFTTVIKCRRSGNHFGSNGRSM